MKLGDIARVSRGIATGDRHRYIMTRAQALERGLHRFVRPVIVSARELPRKGDPIINDGPERFVVLVASKRDVEDYVALGKYLEGQSPRIASVHPPPIVVTYTGLPYFVANPDGLAVTNSLYCVRPRQALSRTDVLSLVVRLNAAAATLSEAPAARYSPRELEALDV
jgi:hypothetical protein